MQEKDQGKILKVHIQLGNTSQWTCQLLTSGTATAVVPATKQAQIFSFPERTNLCIIGNLTIQISHKDDDNNTEG